MTRKRTTHQGADRYDRSLQVGDLIRTYHSGIWRITRIEPRYVTESDKRCTVYADHSVGDEMVPLFHYEKVLDADLTPTKARTTECCDAAWCQRVNRELLEQELETIRHTYQTAIAILFRHD